MAHQKLVLLVDDSTDSRELLATAFADAGYAVLTADNGREALDLIINAPLEPCLIVLDLEMPVMSGWEFLDTIRSYLRLSTIPVIVVSGSIRTPDGHRVQGFLRKPIDPIKLVARVMNGDFTESVRA